MPGTQVRNFTHVDDIVAALVMIGDRGADEYGIGHNQEWSISEVATLFGGPIEFVGSRAGNRMEAVRNPEDKATGLAASNRS